MKCKVLALAAALILSIATDVWANKAIFEKLGVVASRSAKEAPLFSLKNIKGKQVSLESFMGKPILLHFWATWCVPCQEELPALQKLYEQNGGEQFEVVAVNIDRDNPEKVMKYIKKYNLTFPNLMDPDQSVRRKYFIRGLPTSYLIDSNGKLRGFVSGARSWAVKDSKRLFSVVSARAN